MKVSKWLVTLTSILLQLRHQVSAASDAEDTCTIFWATATTVRVMDFHNRTLFRDRTHNIGVSIGSIAWHPASEVFLWSDYAEQPFISILNFASGWPNEIWSRKTGYTQHLSLDWSIGNLYVMNDYALHVVQYRERFFGQCIRAEIASITGEDFAVHPKSGFLFWTQLTDNQYNVMRSWLDGTHVKTIMQAVGAKLALDYVQDLIYVINGYSIAVANLNGGSLRYIRPKWSNGTHAANKNGDRVYRKQYVLSLKVNRQYFRVAAWGDGIAVESRHNLLYVNPVTEEAYMIAHKGDAKTSDLLVFCQHSLPKVTTPCTTNNGLCGTHQICVHTPAGAAKCYSHKKWLQ